MRIEVNGMGRVHLLSNETSRFSGFLRAYVRTTKHPISLVRVTHGLVYNPNIISGGGWANFRGSRAAIEIIKQISRRTRRNTQ